MQSMSWKFSENKEIYTKNMATIFSIEPNYIIIKGAIVENSIDLQNSTIDLSNLCENQILWIIRLPNGDWHTLSYPWIIADIPILSSRLSQWHSQLKYSSKLTDNEVNELFGRKNEQLTLMSNLIPWHAHTTNNRKRLLRFIWHHFNHHIAYSSQRELTASEKIAKII